MIAQAEFSLSTRVRRAEADARDVEALLTRAMARQMPWMTARQIGEALWPALDVEKARRRVRAAAEVSKVIASAPGSQGYALAAAISPEEEIAIAEAIMSQARKMFRDGWRRRKRGRERLTLSLPPPLHDGASQSDVGRVLRGEGLAVSSAFQNSPAPL